MGDWNFNRDQCVKVLLKLGFTLNNKRHGGHDKFAVPERYHSKIQAGRRPFIMVPRHSELRLQHKIIRELELIGGVELVEEFRKLL